MSALTPSASAIFTDEELADTVIDTRRLNDPNRTPYRIGVCMEWAKGTNILRDFLDAVQLAIDEYVESGELDRPVELVVREVPGPMQGTSPVVRTAWRELAEDCLAIIGPVVTEANLAIVDDVNEGRVPTISFCATFDWAGPYAFSLQNGGFPDEASVLAAHMAAAGHRRIGVFHEDGLIGEEFFAAFRIAARRYGLTIVSDHVVGLFNTLQPVRPQLEAVRAANADVVCVLSAYGALPPVIEALRALTAETGWSPARYQNMTWVALTALGRAGDRDLAQYLHDYEGWIGLDQIHEGNQQFQAVLDRFEQRHGRRPFHAYTALGYDHGLVVADALARMKPPSPEGFRDALERLRMRPACIGGPGTTISFGPYDNRGYKGDYIVVRTVREGIEQLIDTSMAQLIVDRPPASPAATATTAVNTAHPARVPFKVGVLQDWAMWARLPDFYNGLTLAFEEAFETGLVDRRIELVIDEVQGPPERDFASVRRSWKRLVHDEQVLAVVGPFITDTVRALRDDVEADRVPMITHAATMKANGEYCFLLPNGTFADETFHTATYLQRRGARSIGVVREDNPIGDEYYEYFRQHARRLGLNITSDQIVAGRASRGDVRRALATIRDAGADGVMHLGYGLTFFETLKATAEVMERTGWNPARATITTWVLLSGLSHPGGSPYLMNRSFPPELFEGWVGVDLPHEDNVVFTGFRQRYAERFGGPEPFSCYPAHYYDIGRALSEAIAHARPVTPRGVRDALERVRMIPATMGGPGTVIGFGPRDHRGYKGAYLVLRGVRDGVEGPADRLFADLLR